MAITDDSQGVPVRDFAIERLKSRIANLQNENRTLREENKQLKYVKSIIEVAITQHEKSMATKSGENDDKDN